MKIAPVRPHLLGDVTAEADRRMLDQAFFESPDYRTLLESADRYVVVGRRGAGKSALVYKLQTRLRDSAKLIVLSPSEDQVIGLRAVAQLFGDQFNRQRAGCRIAWRYALLMEIADALFSDYRFRRAPESATIAELVKEWRTLGGSFVERLRRALRNIAIEDEDPDTRIGELASRLQVERLTAMLNSAITTTRIRIALLLDRLDEGYEPDTPGIGLITGLVLTSLELRDRLPGTVAMVFLRDNVFRTIAKWDPDYTRLIEGQVLRLHWDETQLLNLVAKRLRVAFSLEQENDVRVWNSCTGRGLKDREGFRRCLQFTLYRPRDVILLLNQAFLAAARVGRSEIIDEDIETTAKHISGARLDDLVKEYRAVSPSVDLVVDAFANGAPEYSVQDAEGRLGNLEDRVRKSDSALGQELVILENPRNVLRELHSVGFLGLHDTATGHFVFSHDGSVRDRDLGSTDRLLIHPCYWMALNLTRNQLEPEEAAEINDEYDIQVTSETPHLRAARVGQLIARLGEIPVGTGGWSQFEEWCRDAIRIVFATALDNVALNPNPAAVQRRDVVGTNLGKTPAWRRILEDFQARQVLFEVKNLKDIGPDEFRQILAYLSGDYGRLGFVITRDDDEKPKKGRELDWVRELYYKHNVLIVKLTAKWFSHILGKLRSPQKHDAPEKNVNYLLDTYSRTYLEIPPSARQSAKRGKSAQTQRQSLES